MRERSRSRRYVLPALLVLVLAAVLALPGCARLKRSAYSGPARDRWQQPERVLDTLELVPGQRVADIGSGGGYFTFRIASRVAAMGRVYAVDVDPEMIDYVRERRLREFLPQVRAILATPDDPKLPEPVDWAFTSNTYHHLSDREAYFRGLREHLKPGGRVAIVEFLPSFLGSHATSPETIQQEMAAAGYTLEADHDFLERQSFLVFAPKK